jgi:hypothetical protein
MYLKNFMQILQDHGLPLILVVTHALFGSFNIEVLSFQ